MYKITVTIIAFLWAGRAIMANKVVQTDWHGGPGITGPIANWDITFDNSNNINYLYEWGRISLAIAIESFPNQHPIGDMRSYYDKKLEVADLDNDNDPDIVVAGSDEIRWYENNGIGEFPFYHTIYTPPISGYLGYDIADFDSDGYDDIVIGDHQSEYILLYMNNRDGTFSFCDTIGEYPNGHQVSARDFDNDGDIDVVSTGFHGWSSGIAYWFQNDGTNIHFTRYIIGDDGNGAARRINTGDLDNDGDIDFTVTAQHGTYWFENRISTDGPDPGFIKHTLHNYDSRYDWIEDINRDGNLDIVTAYLQMDHPAWWENDGTGNFTEHPLPSSGIAYPEGVVAMDLDYDGDMDIIQSFWNGGFEGKIAWYENDGDQNFTYRKFSNYPYSCDLQVADMNRNGFYDLITSTHTPGGSIDWWDLFGYFKRYGELVSSILDAGRRVSWRYIEWDEDTPPGTSIKFQVRASNNPSEMGEWSAPIISSGTELMDKYLKDFYRYLQYKVILETTHPKRSPFLYEVRFQYDYLDVGVSSIIAPPDTVSVGDTITPQVYIKNFSPVSEARDFFVICNIDSSGTIVWSDTQLIDYLDHGYSVLVSFDNWVPKTSEMTYFFTFFTSLKYDQYSSNDTLQKFVTTKKGQGIAKSHSTPFFSLRCSPNPVKDFLIIQFQVPRKEIVSLEVYDVNGKRVKTLIKSQSQESGIYTTCWNKRNNNGVILPAGIYFIKLRDGSSALTRKIILVR